MISKYENFTNESLFSKKTFDERIEEINDLLINGRRISAIINTNYQDKIYDQIRINKYYRKFDHNLNIVSDKLNSTMTKYMKIFTKEQMDMFIQKLKGVIRLFAVGSYNMKNSGVKYDITRALENTNSVIFILEYLKSTKYYDYEIDFDTSYEDCVNSLVLIPSGDKYHEVDRKSVLMEKEKKAREEHMAVDPYNEEKWLDEAVRWYYKGKLELDKDLDNDIKTTKDNIIRVGDMVKVEGYWYDKKFNNEVGEVIRIFNHIKKVGEERRILESDDGKEIDIVVKFEGRRNLNRSKLSKYNDCAKFDMMKRREKGKTNVYTQKGNYYDPGIKITKIIW